MSSQNKFFAGLEEVLARLLGIILTLIFFLIYVVAVKELTLDWLQTSFLLGFFWVVYETISVILFSIFSFFAKDKTIHNTTNNTDSNQSIIESQQTDQLDAFDEDSAT